MNTDALIQDVARIVEDESYTPAVILRFINEGLEAVAAECPLPVLETKGTVTTALDAESVRLPRDYQSHLRHVRSLLTRRNVRIFRDLASLRERTNIPAGGHVTTVATVGNLLYYFPNQTEEELELVYHKFPRPYEGGENEPDYIPRHLGLRLLKAYAVKEIYSEIDDSVDGARINEARWESKYEKLLKELKDFLGPFYYLPTREMRTNDVMGL